MMFYTEHLCVVFFAGMAKAEEQKYGPFPNYQGYWDYPQIIVEIPLIEPAILITDPWGNEYTFDPIGGGVYTVPFKVPVFAGTYLEFESAEGSPFDPNTDDITLTDIWARIIEPRDANVIPEQTGFNPTNPEIVPLSGGPQTGGWYKGYSGTIYYADVCEVTLNDLPSVMPDYDLSQFTGDQDSIVYVQQAVVPANDFTPFVFSFDYKGYVEEGDPCWAGDFDANFPYQHTWDMNITQWNPAVAKVNDVDLEAPDITPGYVEIVPPEYWDAETVEYGRYGYETTEMYSIIGEGLYTGFKVNAGTPYCNNAVVTMTYEDLTLNPYVSTTVPKAKPQCGDWGYAAGDIDKDCDVDLVDFAYMANTWLECTNPDGEDCVNRTYNSVGFAFDGKDTIGPATILYLYHDRNADLLEPNDIILEYRGVEVADGNELLELIIALEDVNDGDPVPMKIQREEPGGGTVVLGPLDPIGVDLTPSPGPVTYSGSLKLGPFMEESDGPCMPIYNKAVPPQKIGCRCLNKNPANKCYSIVYETDPRTCIDCDKYVELYSECRDELLKNTCTYGDPSYVYPPEPGVYCIGK